MPAGTPADIVGIGIQEIIIPGFFLGHISPNPISDLGTIDFNASEKIDLSISISNSLGQILMESQINGEKGSNRINFDASNYSNGLHFLEVRVDGKSIIRKFIVQH